MSRKDEFDQKVLSYQTRFLRALRNVQPLAFLSSALFVVAALSRNNFVGASDWAIASAFAFLLAFLVAILAELLPVPPAVYMCWIMTGVGVFFVLLVAYEFSKVVQLVGRLPIAFISLAGVLSMCSVLPALPRRMRDISGKVTGGKKHVLLGLHLLAAAGLGVLLESWVANVAAYLLNADFPATMGGLFIIGVGVFISAAMLLILLENRWLS